MINIITSYQMTNLKIVIGDWDDYYSEIVKFANRNLTTIYKLPNET